MILIFVCQDRFVAGQKIFSADRGFTWRVASRWDRGRFFLQESLVSRFVHLPWDTYNKHW